MSNEKRNFPYFYTIQSAFSKSGQQIFFRLTAHVPLWGGGYSVVNSSTVKPELEKALYQLGFDVVLHIHVIVSVDSGEVLDISGIPGKDSVYSCRVALLRLHYRFKGEKSVAHSLTPPFPHIAAAGRCGYAARCCSAFSRNFPQFPFVSAHKNNRDISFPA